MKEILRELDDKLTSEELDGIIQEIDTDGSGTVDYDGNLFFVSIPKPPFIFSLIFRIYGSDDRR